MPAISAGSRSPSAQATYTSGRYAARRGSVSAAWRASCGEGAELGIIASERKAHPGVDEPAVHPEWRMARVGEDAQVGVRDQVAVGEGVEEVLGPDGQGELLEAVAELQVGHPFGLEGLGHHEAVDQAVLAIAAPPQVGEGLVPVP